MSGVGYYEFFINGAHVSDRKLEPGYTHFDKRVLYSTYDIDLYAAAWRKRIGNRIGQWLAQYTISICMGI